MKFGIRKPSLRKSVKARTTGKLKRKVKKSLNPFYGKKGVGWIKNPKKAIYSKVYNKTSVSIFEKNGLFFNKKSKSGTVFSILILLIISPIILFYYLVKFLVLLVIEIINSVKENDMKKESKNDKEYFEIKFNEEDRKESMDKKKKSKAPLAIGAAAVVFCGAIAAGNNTDTKNIEPTTELTAIVEEVIKREDFASEEAKSSVEKNISEKEETTVKVTEKKKITTTKKSIETTRKAVVTTKKIIVTTKENIVPMEFEYIANTSTGKFHYPDCRGVAQMKDENKETYHCTHDEMIAKGYSPCGICHP